MKDGAGLAVMAMAEYRARLTPWSDIQEQMPLLLAAAQRYARPQIAELGTRTGQSTSALLAGAAATGGHVWSTDVKELDKPTDWTGSQPSLWWQDSGLWSFLAADDMSAEAAAWIPAKLDVLFIDTSHEYEHTLAELRRYVPRVHPGGTVLCHDPELTRDDEVMGLDWVARNATGPQYPVAAALDAYCAETGLTWVRQTERPAPAHGKPFYGLATIMIPSRTEPDARVDLAVPVAR